MNHALSQPAPDARGPIDSAHTRDARIAAALYVGFLVVAPLRSIVTPLTLFGGDAGATFDRIHGHEAMFRAAMLSEVATGLLVLLVALLLHRLLAPVGRRGAVLAAVFGGLMVVPLGVVNPLHDFAALLVVRGGASLDAIPRLERVGLMSFFLRLHEQGVAMYVLFRGLWLLCLAPLLGRSRFVPLAAAAVLAGSGAANVASGAAFFLLPTRSAQEVANWLLFAFVVEIVVLLWLLVGRARRAS